MSIRRVAQPLLAALLAAACLAGGVEGARAQTVVEGTQFTVEWGAASGPVAYYVVSASTDGGQTWERVAETPDALTKQATIDGTAGEDYIVRVRAEGTDGQDGPWSLESETIALRPPLTAPTGLTVTITCDGADEQIVTQTNDDGSITLRCE